MKLKVDHEADGLYLSLGDAPASESKEITPGIIVVYDEKGQVLGISRCCPFRSVRLVPICSA